MKFQSKLPKVGTTIFTVMSALATKTGAINLGQGFPDFPMDPELVELVAKAMRDGYNQYAPMPGHPPLRETLAEKIELLYEHSVNPRYRNHHHSGRHLCHLYSTHNHPSTGR